MGSDEIILLPGASQDMDNGEAFYDKKRAGLGQYFIQSLLADLEALKVYAGIHPKHASLDTRKALPLYDLLPCHGRCDLYCSGLANQAISCLGQ